MSHENLCDLVGEIANTLSNARRDFGHQFNISVPSVVSSRSGNVSYPADTRPIVIPIDWRNATPGCRLPQLSPATYRARHRCCQVTRRQLLVGAQP
jgi:hypothetical protein